MRVQGARFNPLLFRCRATQPWWPGSLLVLAVVVALAGPLACIIHCWTTSRQQQAHHGGMTRDMAGQPGAPMLHEQQMRDMQASVARHNECVEHAQQMPPGAHNEPTALTIAIFTPFMFLLGLSNTRLRRHLRGFRLRHLALPPPLRPPCLCSSFSFAF